MEQETKCEGGEEGEHKIWERLDELKELQQIERKVHTRKKALKEDIQRKGEKHTQNIHWNGVQHPNYL